MANILSERQNMQDVSNSEDMEVQETTDKSSKPRVVYIYNDEYLKLCDSLPKVPKRASMCHSLILAYGLLKKMRAVSPRPARIEELELFHSKDYIECLQKMSEREDDEKYDDEAEQFGLTYDCPAYPGVYTYARYVVGASVKAAQCLMMDLADVAINWPGGWHHAKRDEASGFCYLNDIVVAILKLRTKFSRVLYIDFDLHHGDGVEDAFCATSKVMTVSFHKYSPGFFPGTGKLEDIGIGKGAYYNLNVPLQDGVQDDKYCSVVDRVLSLVKEKFQPDAIVCQCGADGLVEDPMAAYNLTPQALARSLQGVLAWKLPTLLVGGGGYNIPNTSRCWALLTATALGETLSTDIPEHPYFPRYGPDYDLEITPGFRQDTNSANYIEKLLQSIEDHLKNVS